MKVQRVLQKIRVSHLIDENILRTLERSFMLGRGQLDGRVDFESRR